MKFLEVPVSFFSALWLAFLSRLLLLLIWLYVFLFFFLLFKTFIIPAVSCSSANLFHVPYAAWSSNRKTVNRGKGFRKINSKPHNVSQRFSNKSSTLPDDSVHNVSHQLLIYWFFGIASWLRHQSGCLNRYWNLTFFPLLDECTFRNVSLTRYSPLIHWHQDDLKFWISKRQLSYNMMIKSYNPLYLQL